MSGPVYGFLALGTVAWRFYEIPSVELMGGCQNYGPLLGPLNTRCRIILRTQKGTIIWTTTLRAAMIVDVEGSGLFL